MWETRWHNGWRVGLRIKRLRFVRWLGSLRCVLGQDIYMQFSQCLFPPRSINGYWQHNSGGGGGNLGNLLKQSSYCSLDKIWYCGPKCSYMYTSLIHTFVGLLSRGRGWCLVQRELNRGTLSWEHTMYSQLSPCGHPQLRTKSNPPRKLYIEVWLKMTPAIADSRYNSIKEPKLRPEGVRYNKSWLYNQ